MSERLNNESSSREFVTLPGRHMVYRSHTALGARSEALIHNCTYIILKN